MYLAILSLWFPSGYSSEFFTCMESCCCLAAKSCPTRCDPMDCRPSGSSVHGIFFFFVICFYFNCLGQGMHLDIEWCFTFWMRDSGVWTWHSSPWVNCPLFYFFLIFIFFISWRLMSMGFLRQEYWSGLPFPSPGDLPDPEIKTMFLALQAASLPLSHQGKPGGE